MKKYIISVAFFMLIMAGNLKADDYRRIVDYDSVNISTVSFSSRTVNAFSGNGVIYGYGSSTSSVNNYWEFYNSTNTNLNLQATTVDASTERIMRVQNYGLNYTSTTINASGTYWFNRPIRVNRGCAWFFSDQNANSAWLLYKDLNQ